MATKRQKRQRQLIRQLQAKLSERTQSGASSTSLIRRLPTTEGRPIYSSELPISDPWTVPDMFGAYQRGRQFWSGYGGGCSFELLRLAARRCLLIQAVHACCLHEFLQLAPYAPTRQDLGWRVEPQQTQRQQAARERGAQVPMNLSPEMQARQQLLQNRMTCPHPLYEPTFAGFLSKILKDHLTINRVVVELIKDQRGRTVQFRAIDGATILPTYAVLERFIAQRFMGTGKPIGYETAAMQLEQETGHPIRDAEYVCVIRGQLAGTFPHGQLLVWEFDPSTDIREIFAPSYVEKALEGIVSWLYAFQYNKTYFMVGNPIEVILGISGAIEDDSFVALQEQLRENFSGLKGAWRVPVVQLPVEGQMSVIKLKENHRDMQFMEWIDVLISLVCAVYRKHPNRIYFSGKAHEGTAIFEHSREAEIESSEEEGFVNNRIFFGSHLDSLVKLLDQDMAFTWSGLDLDDRQAQIAIETQEVTHYVSVDEMRERKGEQPFGQPWSKLPLNPLIFQAAGLTGGTPGGLGDMGEDGDEDGDPMAQLHQAVKDHNTPANGTAPLRLEEARAALHKADVWEEVEV